MDFCGLGMAKPLVKYKFWPGPCEGLGHEAGIFLRRNFRFGKLFMRANPIFPL